MMRIFLFLLSLTSLLYSERVSAQFGAGGLPTPADLNNLTAALNQANTTVANATTTANTINVTAGQINTTAGQINTTANRAIDTYNDQLSPQIERALGLGETANQTAKDINQTGRDINQTIKDTLSPRNLFIAGLATAAGGALGGLLVNAAVSGVEAIFKYLTTDWDAVALDVYEANIRALNNASERLIKLEGVHAQMAKTYKLMSLPAFKALRDMNQDTRVAKLRVIAHEAMCKNEISPSQLDQLMSFSGSLASFSEGTDKLHSELCRYKALIDTTKLEIQRYVATIQTNFSLAQYALRKKMYEAFDEAAKARADYLKSSDLRLQKAKVALLQCIRGTPTNPGEKSMIELWNEKYCRYKGPEICLTLRQWEGRDMSSNRVHETHNCIWECVPPEMEDINRLGCPASVPIPLIGIMFGRKSECLQLRQVIQDRYNTGCHPEQKQFPLIRTELEAEIEALPRKVEDQKREADLRIRTLEHTIQQILSGTEGRPMGHDKAIEEYHQFLSEICGVSGPR